MRTASATLGCWRRAAAASMVVTVTSPFSKIPLKPAADVLTLRRVTYDRYPKRIPELLATSASSFRQGKTRAHAWRASSERLKVVENRR